MLVLFDIDATLISTSGAGIRAMEDAARGMFGHGFKATGIEYAGSLDPLIVGAMFRAAGVHPTPNAVTEFRAAYAARLASRLADPATVSLSLPGVPALLDRLGHLQGLMLGLLTGNDAQTGSLKLRACGIDPDRFEIAVWGDESPHDPPDRAHLPPIALSRYRARRGHNVDPRRVTIVGDTPHDVRCARLHSCRSLGVATGRFTAAQLADAGADRVVPDLSATHDLASWLSVQA